MQAGSRARHARAYDALRLLPLLALAFAGCVSAPPDRSQQPTRPAPSPAEIAAIPDPVPQFEPRSARGNPPFYEVMGQRYFVMEDSAGYIERGIASWYGPGFHSGSTSNGERYDMYAMTAAHKTLPLPCYVQVTNLRNGKSVVVRVNDRGPFKEGRIIDLSYTAAAKLEMLKDGTTPVEVRALTPQAKTNEAQTAAGSNLFVQAGAFSSEANATSLLERLRSHGVQDSFVRRDEVDGRPLYRVRVGPLPSVSEFDRVVSKLKSLGVADARLAAD